jgi:hypothetical protein
MTSTVKNVIVQYTKRKNSAGVFAPYVASVRVFFKSALPLGSYNVSALYDGTTCAFSSASQCVSNTTSGVTFTNTASIDALSNTLGIAALLNKIEFSLNGTSRATFRVGTGTGITFATQITYFDANKSLTLTNDATYVDGTTAGKYLLSFKFTYSTGCTPSTHCCTTSQPSCDNSTAKSCRPSKV